MRISDWSSDVCSSDLDEACELNRRQPPDRPDQRETENHRQAGKHNAGGCVLRHVDRQIARERTRMTAALHVEPRVLILHARRERIVLYGESLGSAVAVDLAARRPVGAIVLEAAFT